MTRLRSALPSLIALIATAALGLVLLAPLAPADATYVPPILTPQGEKVSEGATLAMVTVKVAGKVKRQLSVPYQTVAGSAKPGRDFKAAKGTLTIKKGASKVHLYIRLVDDKVSEPTEQFSVRFSDDAGYDLRAKTAAITIKDDDFAVVTQWSGDLTVHVTKDQTGNTIAHEDWTMLLHLVLERPDPAVSSWVPTAASSWSATGTKTSTYDDDECQATPTRWEIDTEGTFVADPISDNPGAGESSYWLKNNTGDAAIDKEAPYIPVFEAGMTVADTTRYDYWDYTHTCSEHVTNNSLLTLGFQSHWRTSDPVGHPGTFPLILTIKGGQETSLTADFEDTYTEGAVVTNSTVTGTLLPTQTK